MRKLLLCCVVSGLCAFAQAGEPRPAPWPQTLVERIETLDRESPGTLGVYVKRLADGQEMRYAAEGPWYLASTVKVPIAMAVLEAVDEGELSLDQEVELQESDRIDGSGELVWQDAGTRHTVEALLEAMLRRSDNTAANMLIRVVGQDAFDRRVAAYMGSRDVRITDFVQIRRDIYAELHPDAARLDNARLVEIAGANIGPARVRALRRALDVPAEELVVDSMEEAYARYYGRQLNAAGLHEYGAMLERLVKDDVLSDAARDRLYDYMKLGESGDYRLEGGLSEGTPFIHKTGTQFERACHVGVAHPQDGGARATIIVACASGLDEGREAGPLLQRVGEIVAEVVLQPGDE